MTDVFISYCQADAKLTVDLAKALELNGFSTWWDTRLLPGDEFPEIIAQEIDKAKVVIVIWTPDSVKSRWVRREAYRADRQAKLISLATKNLNIETIPFPFDTYQIGVVDDIETICKALQKRSVLKLSENIRDYSIFNSQEISSIRESLDDTMRMAGNLIGYIYETNDKIAARLQILGVDAKYKVNKNYDTDAEIILSLQCDERSTHFYTHWIRADPESGKVEFLRDLNIQAFDVDTGQNLDWLPIGNEPTSKVLAVFFTKMLPNSSKKIKLTYQWPRFMGQLLDLGATIFDWSYHNANPKLQSRFRAEWIFDNSIAPIECRIIGNISDTATLHVEEHSSTFSWIYEDHAALLSKKYEVEFFKF